MYIPFFFSFFSITASCFPLFFESVWIWFDFFLFFFVFFPVFFVVIFFARFFPLLSFFVNLYRRVYLVVCNAFTPAGSPQSHPANVLLLAPWQRVYIIYNISIFAIRL